MLATTWQQLIASPNSQKTYLAIIQPAKKVLIWTKLAGKNYIYYTFWGEKYSNNDIDYFTCEHGTCYSRPTYYNDFNTQLTDLDEMNNGFAFSKNDQYLYINMYQQDPNTHTVVVYFKIYLSTHPKIFTQDVFLMPYDEVVYFEPLIKSPPDINRQADEVIFTNFQNETGELVLNNNLQSNLPGQMTAPYGAFDIDFNRLIWRDKYIWIYVGGEDLPFSEYQQEFLGMIEDDSRTDTEIKFKLQGFFNKTFDTKIPNTLYSSSTYPNIDPNAIGSTIPLLMGVCYNVKPTCINTTTWRYKCCSNGIRAITKVREDGVDITSNLGYDSNSLALGEFWLTAKTPSGVITVDVTGWGDDDNANDFLTYPWLFYYVVINQGGLSQSYIDLTSLTNAFTGANFFPIGVYIDNPTPIREIINKANESVMAFNWRDRAGIIKTKRWGAPAATATYLYEIEDISDLQVEKRYTNLYKTVQVGYDKNYCRQGNTYRGVKGIAVVNNWDYDSKWSLSTDTAATIKYRATETLIIDSYINGDDASGQIADSYLQFTKQPWEIISFKIKLTPLRHSLMDTIEVNAPRMITLNNRRMVIIGINERTKEGITELKCFKLYE